ncbi:hypothetical protein ABFX02_01G080000 [Erythranthe guttata]
MARPDQEAIDTFMSITGVSEAAAIQKLEDHHGSLNEAVNAHFSENTALEAAFTAPQNDVMDIDDSVPGGSHRQPCSLPPFARDLDPFSLIDPNFTRSASNSRPPFVEIPVEVKDGTGSSVRPGNPSAVEATTETARATYIIDDDSDEEKNYPDVPITVRHGPSAPTIIDVPDYNNDIEEEMIRAAIEASKKDAAVSNQQYDDHDIDNVGASELEASKSALPESLHGRQSQLEIGSSSIQDETEDEEEEELQLVRHRRRRVTSTSVDTPPIDIGGAEVLPPSIPQQNDTVTHSRDSGTDFPSEWGGISSEEHDEAVMLEAAMFGGVPEETGYRFPPYAPHRPMHNDLYAPYPMQIPRPPSPSLTAQRLIREQQNDEYLAALQADREKELKAKEDAEAALAEERRKEEESHRKLLEQQEIERQLAAKEASLPQEPNTDDDNSVTLLVRMPDGTRRSRRFHKSDKLQYLFDFIDIGRGITPGSYRLVRSYPRRAFSDGESSSTMNELGLTSKQEALYLELI